MLPKKTKIQLIAINVVFIELIVFSDYLVPFQWGKMKVSGLACTCPDETVVSGKLYLRSITPDSLKKFDLDYSEIYVTEDLYADTDPMGVANYIIKGEVIGKRRVSEYEPWNPKVKIKEWRYLDPLSEWLIRGLFFGQFFILYRLLKQKERIKRRTI